MRPHKSLIDHASNPAEHDPSVHSGPRFQPEALLNDENDTAPERFFDQITRDFSRDFGNSCFDHSGPIAAPGTQLAVFSGNDNDIPIVSGPLSQGGGHGSGSSAPGGAGSAATGTALVANAASSGLIINVTYDASVASAPAAFKSVVASVVQYFESLFSDPITINIAVGYGEAAGYSLGGALGMSLTYLTNTTYSALKSALGTDSKSTDDAAAVASLPAGDPTGTNHFWVSTAEAKALGLPSAASSVDGYVGFSSSANIFDYDNSNGVSAGQYDLYGVVAHEISEVMGRFLLVGETVGSTATNYMPLDLFHYSAAGVRDLVGTQAGYFSLNGGTTKLYDFNTNPNGDFGDWAASAGANSFLAFANSGVVLPVTANDLKVMDAIGWDAAQTSNPPPPPPPSSNPDLTLSGLSLHDTTLSVQIHNGGVDPAAASTAGLYLSTDATITAADTLFATIATPTLAANATFNTALALSFPSNLAAGTYYLGAIADYNGQIAETNETNNASTAPVRIILGNSSANLLTGTTASDTIIAQGGSDTLVGGAGTDTLIGGSATDHFRYNARTDGLDTIVDFSSNDSLDFSRLAFGNRLATGGASIGTLAASHFASNSTGSATAATAQFIYNATTHVLSFDSDGTGAAAAVNLAQLENGFVLGNANIHLV